MATGPQTRRTHHTARINGTRNGPARFWWAANWVMSELRHLAKRDPSKAQTIGTHLADQMLAIARDLNDQHHQQLKGGRARV